MTHRPARRDDLGSIPGEGPSGPPQRPVRAPLIPMSADQVDALRSDLERLDVLDSVPA